MSLKCIWNKIIKVPKAKIPLSIISTWMLLSMQVSQEIHSWLIKRRAHKKVLYLKLVIKKNGKLQLLLVWVCYALGILILSINIWCSTLIIKENMWKQELVWVLVYVVLALTIKTILLLVYWVIWRKKERMISLDNVQFWVLV